MGSTFYGPGQEGFPAEITQITQANHNKIAVFVSEIINKIEQISRYLKSSKMMQNLTRACFRLKHVKRPANQGAVLSRAGLSSSVQPVTTIGGDGGKVLVPVYMYNCTVYRVSRFA